MCINSLRRVLFALGMRLIDVSVFIRSNHVLFSYPSGLNIRMNSRDMC